MDISKIHLVYFSATYTTRKIARLVAKQLCESVTEYDVTQITMEECVAIGAGEMLILAAPVYAGRIPPKALESFRRFRGNNTPAILLGVYGNREYDDALLEMKDLVEENGFRVVSAGAFIARHSIFPQVASDRPDVADLLVVGEFGAESARRIANLTDIGSLPPIAIKGNRPYKTPGKIPLRPKGDKSCNECGICVGLCPVHAILEATPRKTDKEKCISCGRCIVVCPRHARRFGGLLYKLVGSKFVKANSLRQEPELFYA